jgi:hypothetical protein
MRIINKLLYYKDKFLYYKVIYSIIANNLSYFLLLRKIKYVKLYVLYLIVNRDLEIIAENIVWPFAMGYFLARYGDHFAIDFNTWTGWFLSALLFVGGLIFLLLVIPSAAYMDDYFTDREKITVKIILKRLYDEKDKYYYYMDDKTERKK